MRKARILIVDDSTVIRRLLTDALVNDPLVEVVGTAANGRIALQKIPQVNPDLVTLDIEMPELDGLATLKELRREYPRLPVIMFSTLTEKGALATINALSLGASDYVTKPSNVGSVTAGINRVQQELLPKIKAFCPWMDLQAPPAAAPLLPGGAMKRPMVKPQSARIDVIAIGVSTGGPNALAEVFRGLRSNLSAPIVIVQHMPPVFTRYLAERLDNNSPVHVQEAQSGETLSAGGAWIAPGDFHLSLVRHGAEVRTKLHQSPPENSCRPAVDVLFRSVAEVYGPNVLAVVLTGMGYDGQRGCEAIRAAGGRVIAQDEASSVVWGMPGAVVRAGLADEILPLSRVAERISQLTGSTSRSLAATAGGAS